ncbi:MAG: Hsp20/alpha crystallin family protein [Desulfamplus sp.]|nr:Hsp20/alpha crystallin family protein [Desulfamplus sp.]MBF0258767.1 Hsp20/alpha crystallin family protein [Desulfamplus sp.]
MITRRMFNFPAPRAFRHPFFEIDALQKEMDRWANLINSKRSFGGLNAGVFPSLNITEDKDNYYIRAELPGIKSEEIDIQLNGRSLTISGERKTELSEENLKYHRRERDSGKFSRGVMLPGDIDVENVNANMVNGMLTVKVGKAELAKPKRISVN